MGFCWMSGRGTAAGWEVVSAGAGFSVLVGVASDGSVSLFGFELPQPATRTRASAARRVFKGRAVRRVGSGLARALGPVGAALAEEALEVAGDRLAGGKVLLGDLVGLDLVHRALQPLDEGLDLGIARPRGAPLLLIALGGLLELRGLDGHSRRALEPPQ